MSGPEGVEDREPTPFEESLALLETEVRRRGARRVTLDEIVEVIRADREAADR